MERTLMPVLWTARMAASRPFGVACLLQIVPLFLALSCLRYSSNQAPGRQKAPPRPEQVVSRGQVGTRNDPNRPGRALVRQAVVAYFFLAPRRRPRPATV